MISGASSEELDIANARADIILALDNTATYESWLYIDTYIESLENEKQQLITWLEDKIKEKADTIKIDKRDTVEEIEKIISRQLGELNAYQEVLDFVRGGKE